MKRTKSAVEVEPVPLTFTRAHPRDLEGFDPSSKRCTMNCGPHAQDPRSEAERRFLCPECVEECSA